MAFGQTVFGMKLYEVNATLPDVGTIKQVWVTTPDKLLLALADLVETQKADNVVVGPIHIPGLKISFEPIDNAMRFVGWNGDYLPFDVFQDNYFCLKEHLASEEMNVVRSSRSGIDMTQLLTFFSEEFLSGHETDLVICCERCMFWAEFDWDSVEHYLYHTHCPACEKIAEVPMMVVERKFFEESNKLHGKWETLQDFQGELVVAGTRDKH